MAVLNRDCMFTLKNKDCNITTLLIEWVFVLMTVIWTGVGVWGIISWKRVQEYSVNYNMAAIFMVFVKFFLMYIGLIFGASQTTLFLIFWLQTMLNIANSFMLHSLIAQFHKRTSKVLCIGRCFYCF